MPANHVKDRRIAILAQVWQFDFTATVCLARLLIGMKIDI
jgi:hypothetical protein